MKNQQMFMVMDKYAIVWQLDLKAKPASSFLYYRTIVLPS
jgi:hypothetical protein